MISLLEKNRWLAIVFTSLIAIEIFYFSTLQGGTGTGGCGWLAKVYHFIAFFLFAFFLFISLKRNRKIKFSYVIITLIISILYAISDEIHQIFVPLRDASIRDALTDTLGICFAIITGLIINKKHH
ncbi:VanZ family protein [Candidatus Pacearchaeota archaeon]|nr:VanZ family protein [Candidatus Pacearchaeota archaeon]